MNLPLQAVMQTFCIEARERIAELEAGLLTLEQAPSDTEALSAVFRAAHTIKGSAGMLGLDAVSAFTHGFEDVLDALRTGARRFEHRLGELLLLAADHLALLLDAAEAGEVPDAALQAAGTALLQALHEEPQAS
ncbi:MAG TPA: Hpt domain-containing protein, partial [Plasticicumulans sp.]|nr:Hpt domain-containing protein [Plasticicumulans sp.]